MTFSAELTKGEYFGIVINRIPSSPQNLDTFFQVCILALSKKITYSLSVLFTNIFRKSKNFEPLKVFVVAEDP